MPAHLSYEDARTSFEDTTPETATDDKGDEIADGGATHDDVMNGLRLFLRYCECGRANTLNHGQ